MKYIGIHQNLLTQFHKVFAHNRHWSYKTKERYADAFRRFLRFASERYQLEKLQNIAPKHIYAYVEDMRERGLSAATIKTDLAAIRFFHDQLPNAKHKLPDNAALDLHRRKFGGVDRTWSTAEFNRMLTRAMLQNHDDYAAVLCLARYAALRLHKCFRMDTATAERALKTGVITIKGNGGLVRNVSINESIAIVLRGQLAVPPRGQKLFVASLFGNEPTNF